MIVIRQACDADVPALAGLRRASAFEQHPERHDDDYEERFASWYGRERPRRLTWLAEDDGAVAGHGVIPIGYGDGVADRIREAAGKVDAFIDTFGADYVQLALELGVEPSRIDTIVRFDAVAEYGVKAEGNAAGASASVLAELAGLIAEGNLEVPIAETFPLSQVQDAYRHLEQGHIRGKVVLTLA